MGNGARHPITYIILCENDEIYCGKTVKGLDERIKQHLSEKIPGWFGVTDKRKKIKLIYYCKGNYEKKIKAFGARNIINLYSNMVVRYGGV